MHAFDVLGHLVRRRILELLAGGELASGASVEEVQREFAISQPVISQHLKVLRTPASPPCALIAPAGSTSSMRNRWPRSTHGGIDVAASESITSTYSPPRLHGASARGVPEIAADGEQETGCGGSSTTPQSRPPAASISRIAGSLTKMGS